MKIKRIIFAHLPRNIVLDIKYLYQIIYRIMNGKRKIQSKYEHWNISKQNAHVFFGYYDISPFNNKSNEIIYLVLPKNSSKIHIMLNSIRGGAEQEIAQSNAWNWQQGNRLRWMPNNSREIVFNDYDGKKYFTRIICVDTKEERRIDYPLYDISPDGHYALSIDFERLGIKRPGYGYNCRPYTESDHLLENERIEYIDLINNRSKTIVTYKDIVNVIGNENVDLNNNYLNHLSFSPSGKQFLFFWLTIEGNTHNAFLLVHNLCSNHTRLLEKEEKVSHYVWQDENHIICTAIDKMKREHYYRYTVSTGEKELLNPSIFNRDGHPSLIGNKILTDTYPDLKGYQHLYIAEIGNASKETIIDIYSNCRIEGERRTDLHPRLNMNNRIVCFDACVRKYRELFFLKYQ